MSFVIEKSWLIVLLPFLSFLVCGLFLRKVAPKLAGVVATLSIFTSAVLTYVLAVEFFLHSHEATKTLIPLQFEWLSFMPGISVQFGVLLDSISVMLMLVVTTVSTLVHLYSNGYMHDDPGFARFFTYLSLFTFSMLGLVVAPNLFQMYVFWELVGVSSFLLIGFYYQKQSAVSASKKAFIVTRFADLFFLIGILILSYYGFLILPLVAQASNIAAHAGVLDFAYLTNEVVLKNLSQTGVLTLAMVFIFIGGAGKSAMMPLHIWLPDAMEGPTPVSALIHAATMVVAGVYLVARMFPAFSAAPHALEVVSFIGLVTSAFAALIACTQDDIKRVLAFSTLSQLGYMMFSLGIARMDESLGFTASMFHLFTHAFFKALLFLGAGSIIHAVHSNNVWDMGGLRKKMPITHITFLIAVLAIAGVWPFAGFFSKDEILLAAFEGGHWFHFVGGLIVAMLTSFYMARIYFLSFTGTSRSEHASHAHESSFVMTLPLLILALFSMIAGFVPFAHYVFIGAETHHEGINWMIAGLGTLAAILGLGSSYIVYGRNQFVINKNFAQILGKNYYTIKNKFYFDEGYLFVTKKIIFNCISAPIAWFDRNVVDGAVNLSGWFTQKLGFLSSRLQTGQLQTYGVWFVCGVVVTLILFWVN